MTAALTLLIILAVSLIVVRIGGTALRLTGMSLDAARFQSISALTGTGFTTQEAETTMHHPVRRRVLIGLMFAGHLGVVSLASAIILAVSTAQDGAVLWTILYMLLAIVVICAVALSKMFDIFLCRAITMVLKSLGWFDGSQHLVITELPDGTQVAEHTAQQNCNVDAANLGLMILRVNDAPPGSDTLRVTAGDRVLCFGSPTAHLALNAVTAKG
ncbi:MAG: hypothetical protein ACJAXK_000587 [Yoonia sp.]|jgi:hypothetical protein